MFDQKTILVIGTGGQLAQALQSKIPDALFIGRPTIDLTDITTLHKLPLDSISCIINAAAYTSVDEAETEAGRRDAWNINATAVYALAQIAKVKNIPLIHVSTDYVFDGSQPQYTEGDLVCPLNVYGQSKAAGELAVRMLEKFYLVRTEWVMGKGKNFIRTMISLAERGISPKVINDQFGRPTFASVLADALIHLVQKSAPYGVYHISNSGPIASWADIAKKVFEYSKSEGVVETISTEEYFKDKPSAAPRPLSSVFNLDKIQSTGFSPEDWQISMEKYLKEEFPQHR